MLTRTQLEGDVFIHDLNTQGFAARWFRLKEESNLELEGKKARKVGLQRGAREAGRSGPHVLAHRDFQLGHLSLVLKEPEWNINIVTTLTHHDESIIPSSKTEADI